MLEDQYDREYYWLVELVVDSKVITSKEFDDFNYSEAKALYDELKKTLNGYDYLCMTRQYRLNMR